MLSHHHSSNRAALCSDGTPPNISTVCALPILCFVFTSHDAFHCWFSTTFSPLIPTLTQPVPSILLTCALLQMPITTVRLTLRLWVDHESFRRQHNCGDVRPGGQLKNNYSGIPQIIFNYDTINDEHASLNLKDLINTHTSCVKRYIIGNPLNPGPESARWRSGQCGLVILYIERPLE